MGGGQGREFGDFLIYSGKRRLCINNQPQSSQRTQRVAIFLCVLCALV